MMGIYDAIALRSAKRGSRSHAFRAEIPRVLH
jgi:hypothetical protein